MYPRGDLIRADILKIFIEESESCYDTAVAKKTEDEMTVQDL